jgi:hypothetical protein
MLPEFGPPRSSKAWRAAFLITALLVVSYLFFEVLDLDGSNFPLKQFALERSAIAAELAKESGTFFAAGKTLLHGDFAFLAPPPLLQSLQAHAIQSLHVSHFASARQRGYRIALPRSSPTDPSHS